MADDAIKVSIRVRPLNSNEIEREEQAAWECTSNSLTDITAKGKSKTWDFTNVLNPGTQQEVYELVALPIVRKAMDGFNGTVFAYGQTGSGKTWSTMGDTKTADLVGIIPRSIEEIFSVIEGAADTQFLLRASYLEVYNEKINDLLAEGKAGKNLRIVADDPVKGAIIKELTEEIVSSRAELLGVIERGESNRHYGSTLMNQNSSRSHTIYRTVIEAKRAQSRSTTTSYLNLVDLAGSERQADTGATGKQLAEGANINKSLLTLGVCINKLGQAHANGAKAAAGGKGRRAKKLFIPYRDSKMTRILKNSLGGNTFTSIICALGPSASAQSESESTLKFGQMCKAITNQVGKNEVVDDKTLLKQYRNRITELQKQLEEAAQAVPEPTVITKTVEVGVGKMEVERKRREQLEEQVNKLKKLVMIAGEPERKASLAMAAGGRKGKYRQSITVCVNADQNWGNSKHLRADQLFNITEDYDSDEEETGTGVGGTASLRSFKSEGLRRPPKRRSLFVDSTGSTFGGSVVGSAGSGEAPGGFNVWKEKSVALQKKTDEKSAEVTSLYAQVAGLEAALEAERESSAITLENSISLDEHRADMSEAESQLQAGQHNIEELEGQLYTSQTQAHEWYTAYTELEQRLAEQQETSQRYREQLDQKATEATAAAAATQEASAHEAAHAAEKVQKLQLALDAEKEHTQALQVQVAELTKSARGMEAAEARAKEDKAGMQAELLAGRSVVSTLEQRVRELDATLLRMSEGGVADREAHVTEKEAELELREKVAEKLEREWSTRHRDVISLVKNFEAAGDAGTKSDALTNLLDKWELRINNRFEEMLAMEAAAADLDTGAMGVGTSTLETGPEWSDHRAQVRGYLIKQERSGRRSSSSGKSGGWKKRFFILEAASTTLLYYDNDQLTKLKGEVDLGIADLNLIPDATAPTPLVFQLLCDAASNPDTSSSSITTWLYAILERIQASQPGSNDDKRAQRLQFVATSLAWYKGTEPSHAGAGHGDSGGKKKKGWFHR